MLSDALSFCACVIVVRLQPHPHHMIPTNKRTIAKMSTQRAELEEELFSACEAGDVDRVRRVIAAGVDPKKTINKNRGAWELIEETPLHAACRYVVV